MFAEDTIAAISTPLGRGGIGIVRLSGVQALAIASSLLSLRAPLAHAQARFATVMDPATATALDEAVATYFAGPRSYTVEDVVEIATHGSPVVLGRLLELCVQAGARLAEPGEFTQRAFLAGRLDLTEAEAVNDLIHASTMGQARVAAAQLGGALAREIVPVKHALIQLIAALEAGVDFAEDDLDLLPDMEIAARLAAVRAPLQALAGTYAYGRLLRHGVSLALVGRPNAGKSSLFNRLIGHDRAIVTEHPGTTRDAISQAITLNGLPVELIDTAGLRDAPAGPHGEVEAHGIARTRTTMSEADLVLHVIDASVGFDAEDEHTARALTGRPYLALWNKADLASAPADALQVSARTGQGMDALRQAILHSLGATPPGSDGALVTSLRQHGALVGSLASLAQAEAALERKLAHEFVLLDLHAALEHLDALTGTTTPDDVLAVIFSSFCIGK